MVVPLVVAVAVVVVVAVVVACPVILPAASAVVPVIVVPVIVVPVIVVPVITVPPAITVVPIVVSAVVAAPAVRVVAAVVSVTRTRTGSVASTCILRAFAVAAPGVGGSFARRFQSLSHHRVAGRCAWCGGEVDGRTHGHPLGLRHHANAEEAGETAHDDEGNGELGEARNAARVSRSELWRLWG